MKKNLLTLFTIYFSVLNLQSQTWAWARAPLGTGGGEGTSVATDPNGNSFTTGQLGGNPIFGSTTLTIAGQKAFIAKYDPNGNALWAKASTGTSDALSWAVTADVNGNSFITGVFFNGTSTFGSTTFTNSISGLNGDVFLAKYDVNGNLLWARSAASTGNDNGRSVVTDASGNVIITGEFGGPSITFGTYTLTNSGIKTVFTVKYDPSGNVLWAKQNTSGGADIPYSVDADPIGNVIIAGSFDGFTTAFGAFTLNNLSTASPKEDMFIAKYSPTGTELWAKNTSSSMQHDRAYSVGADAAGNSYVTGYYNAFTSSMNCSGFLSKYDPNGSLLWTKYTSVGFGGPYGNIGYSLSTYTNGVWVGGAMSGSSIILGTYTVSVPSYMDPVYLAHYDQNGNVMYAKAILSGGDDNFGVRVDNNCNILVSSDFQLPKYPFGTDTLKNTGGESIFIAKLNYGCQAGVGVEEFNKDHNNFSIYPNPTSNILNLRSDSKNISTVEIINYLGQTVLKQNYSGSIDISKLESGYYILKISGEKTYYSKFIKE